MRFLFHPLLILCLAGVALERAAAGPLFMGLGDLPDGATNSTALGISGDGQTVVGSSFSSSGQQAFRWTPGSGMTGLGDLAGGTFLSSANAVSADGSVVVGSSSSSSGTEAFRWTQSTGMVGLGDLPGGPFQSVAWGVSGDGLVVVGEGRIGGFASQFRAFRWTETSGIDCLRQSSGDCETGGHSKANDVSTDGSIIVGQRRFVGFCELPCPPATEPQAFRWTAAEGLILLGDLAGGSFLSEALAVSAEGTVIVGYGTSASGREAFRWAEGTGMAGLGDLPGGAHFSTAFDVSADGSVVVGSGTSSSGTEAFIWNTAQGLRGLQAVLTNDYGLDLTGWTLTQANAISDDGSTIVGVGRNPAGQTEGWLARLTDLPVLPAAAPPPAAFPQPEALLQQLPAFIDTHLHEISSDAISFIDRQLIRLGDWAIAHGAKQGALNAANVLSDVGLLLKLASVLPTARIDPVRGLIGLGQFFVTAPVAAIDDPQTKYDFQTLLTTQTLAGCFPIQSCLLSVNAWVWGSLLPYQLRQFGADPPSADFASFYVPRLPLPAFLPSTGDAEVDTVMRALFDAAFRSQAFLDAVNASLDRYAGALAAGDGNAAMLQIQAILHYLSLYDEAVQEGARQLNLIQGLLEDIEYDPVAIAELQEFLAGGTGLEEFNAFFESFGLSADEIAFVTDSILDLDPDAYSGTLFSALSDTRIAALSFSTAAAQNTAAEPPLGELFIACVLVFIAGQHRRCRAQQRPAAA